MSDTLLLNANHEPISILPLSIIGWQQAIKLIFLDKVTVLSNHEGRFVHSSHITMPVPSVCVTKEYFNPMKYVKFTRSNLFLRDMYQCQFCEDVFNKNDLTIDHVIPKSMGGTTTWENCVTACKSCNWDKGSKLTKPVREPFRPEYFNLVSKWKKKPTQIQYHPDWLPYLGIADDVEVRIKNVG